MRIGPTLGVLVKERLELEKGRSELENKDCKLQTASMALESANQLAKERKAKLEHAEFAFPAGEGQP